MWRHVAEELHRSSTAFARELGRKSELHSHESTSRRADYAGRKMAVHHRKLSVKRPARRSGPTSRQVALWTCLALVLSLLTPATATELDIPVFAGGYGTAFYEETARLFEAEPPGVTVKLYGDPRISDKIRVRMIDGNPPDVSMPRDLLIP